MKQIDDLTFWDVLQNFWTHVQGLFDGFSHSLNRHLKLQNSNLLFLKFLPFQNTRYSRERKKRWQPILVLFSRRCVRTDLAKKKRLADLEAMHQAAAEDYWSLGSVNLERGGLNWANLHWIAMKPPSNLEFYELYILSVVSNLKSALVIFALLWKSHLCGGRGGFTVWPLAFTWMIILRHLAPHSSYFRRFCTHKGLHIFLDGTRSKIWKGKSCIWGCHSGRLQSLHTEDAFLSRGLCEPSLKESSSGRAVGRRRIGAEWRRTGEEGPCRCGLWGVGRLWRH